MFLKLICVCCVSAPLSFAFAALPAGADTISPKLRQDDVTYSMAKPNQQVYGTGIASRATEASALRLQAEHDLQSGRVHDAVAKARKAAQFDPDSADSHLVLAHALSACLRAGGYQDKQMYDECMHEWRILRWHDANIEEQQEAGQQIAKLRLARVWSKLHPEHTKDLSM